MDIDIYSHKNLEDYSRDIGTKSKQLEKECYVDALQKRVTGLENSIVELLRLEHKNDYQIYKEFQYKTWDKLSPIISRYLMDRYGFTLAKRGTLRWLEECYKKPITSSECVGESFDKYKLELSTIEPNDIRLKRSLADFTSAQLSEVMEAVVEVLNQKKEQTTW